MPGQSGGGGRGRHGDGGYARGGGGYDDRRGGNDDRRGGNNDRRGGNDDRRSGNDDRRGGNDDRRGGNNDRRGGNDDRRGGNDDRRGGYDDRRGGGYDNGGRGGGGYDNGGRGGGGGGQNGSGGGGNRDDRQGRGGGGYRGGGGREGGRGGREGGRGGRDGGRGGRDGGRGRRDGGRGGGRGRGPDLSGITSCVSNIILANVSQGFQFYLYSVNCMDANGDAIDSRYRRKFLFDTGLWDGLLKDMPDKEKNDLKRVVFFSGSFFMTARPIAGLEPQKLPLQLPTNAAAEGDTIKVQQCIHYLAPKELSQEKAATGQNELAFDKRCSNCAKAFPDVGSLLQHCQQADHAPVYAPDESASGDNAPKHAQMEVFSSYVNGALQRALGERLARWGSEFIDPTQVTEPSDRQGNSMGVRVYEAFSCRFNPLRPGNGAGPAHLALTVDLRAKIVRTMSVLEHLAGNAGPAAYSPNRHDQDKARREWIGTIVISMHDKKCYSVTDLIFDQSAASMPVEGLGMSHAEYFKQRKNVELKYPNAKPMIAVLGRRNQTIYLPAEMVAGNELERRVKEQLPMIASYKPEARNVAIDKIRSFLVPGAQKTKGAGGLLPALGIVLHDSRLNAKAEVLPLPMILAAGVQVPVGRGENWAPLLSRANFNVVPKQSNTLNVILVYNEKLQRGAIDVYNRIRDLVNGFGTAYRFSPKPFEMVKAGDNERHWGAVDKCFSQKSKLPDNVFVLDFTKPRGGSDPAYPVVKQMLTASGFLSQFVNFVTYEHQVPRDEKRSSLILQSVARQILQKTGVRLWWVSIPRSLPTPSVFVGVDVFHAPRVYDPIAKKRVAKASCAAIIVQIVRSSDDKNPNIELYTETYAREAGKEYDLGEALKTTVSNALRELNVEPKSCVVWRDGIGDSAFDHAAQEEIVGIRAGLNGVKSVGGGAADRDVPLSYIVCQKRIDTKFLARGVANEPDGKHGAPSGTLIQGIQGLDYQTFYINGRAPPFSTPKPVRFIVVKQDEALNNVPLPGLTWNLCHDYPNWAGPIKVPSVCQMAHKLAELGGGFADCGRNIHANKLKNTVHFL